MTLPHVADEHLAQLAEGSLPPAEANAIRQHLGVCRSCLAIYVDAVRYRAAWLADADAFRAGGGETRLAIDRRGREGSPVPRASRIHNRMIVPAMIAVLAIVATIFGFGSGHEAPPTPFRLPAAVEMVLSRSPGDGLLLPGVTSGHAAEMRSGSASNSATLDATVNAAVEDYEGNRKDTEACARLVAALLASGEVETANEYAIEGLASRPDHVPLLVLAAECKLRANDLTAAEELLRRAAGRAPRDPLVSLDLGIVLCQGHHVAQARTQLERAARSSSANIAQRARREMENLGRR